MVVPEIENVTRRVHIGTIYLPFFSDEKAEVVLLWGMS